MAKFGLNIQAPKEIGWHTIASPQQGQTSQITFSILKLESGSEYEGQLSGETVAVILYGLIEAEVDGKRWVSVGQRRDVFTGKAFALYLPPNARFRIKAQTFAELAFGSVPAPSGGEPKLITPEQVRTRTVGVFNWRRDIDDIVDASFPARRLLVGETRNPPGNWSSYPPHKHEQENPPFETQMEEVYHFRIFPPNGFAIQVIYTDDGELNEAIIVKEGDTVVIPRGYHPVAAPPGYSVYYLWMLAGDRRQMFVKFDPAHEWVNGAEGILREWQRWLG
ncbi:MAG: 5-deoxy-glucuronate isomerase [Armatimonadetes bacterium]|nr:5-deoxy-glucuronate isomerase [Armatimonadota bacterium]MDW8027285.1 5-deoxy-glucuronate isomerase [Armatimonadota bacterium]